MMEALIILMTLTQITVLICLILLAMRIVSAVEKFASAYEMSVLDRRNANPKSD